MTVLLCEIRNTQKQTAMVQCPEGQRTLEIKG